MRTIGLYSWCKLVLNFQFTKYRKQAVTWHQEDHQTLALSHKLEVLSFTITVHQVFLGMYQSGYSILLVASPPLRFVLFDDTGRKRWTQQSAFCRIVHTAGFMFSTFDLTEAECRRYRQSSEHFVASRQRLERYGPSLSTPNYITRRERVSVPFVFDGFIV